MLHSPDRYNTIASDNRKKILSVILLAFGMSLFSGIVWLRVEVWAQKKEAEVAHLSSELTWESYLYQKTAREVLERRRAARGMLRTP